MGRGAFVGAAGAGLLAGLPSLGSTTVAADDAKARPQLVYALRVAGVAAAVTNMLPRPVATTMDLTLVRVTSAPCGCESSTASMTDAATHEKRTDEPLADVLRSRGARQLRTAFEPAARVDEKGVACGVRISSASAFPTSIAVTRRSYEAGRAGNKHGADPVATQTIASTTRLCCSATAAR